MTTSIRRMMAITMLCLAGCGAPPPSTIPSEPLRIAAASDLQAVFPQIVDRFRAESGVEISPTFGASGQLAQQIRQGAPFDLFMAANRKFVADLGESGNIRADSIRDYARGSLVLIAHEDKAGEVKGIADLKSAMIRHVSIANPDLAPYGMAAKQTLERSGLWEELKPKIAQSETVRQALQFVQTGNADAGFVGKAIANVKGVKIIAAVDPSLHDPLIQSLGIVTNTKRAEDAERFARFMLSDEGKKILTDAGFSRP